MKNEKGTVSSVKRFLLLIAYGSLLILWGCDTILETPRDTVIPETGYGRVIVTINGALARTVFPTMAFAKYEYLFAKVIWGTPGTPEAQTPIDGFFTLELGSWQLTVKAYAEADDTAPAATGVSGTFTVTSSGVAQVEVKLNGNAATGEGKFVYTITYPAGATISVFSLKNLKDDNAAVITITGGGETSLSGIQANVSAGYYFLTIQLTEGTGDKTAGANEVVYIYDKLDSEYRKDFTADDFSHIHDWNTTYTTIIPATETTNGIETITCSHNASHTKETRIAYATGTAGLDFVLISSNTAYSVRRGTATGAIHIPAYRLYNDNYLPVTISGNEQLVSSAFGGTSSSPNTTVTAVTFAAESQITSIAAYVFYNCSRLTSIEIPAGVTSIGGYAFEGCSRLTSVTIPAGVTSIGLRAFCNCSSLTSITIPDGVTTIGNGAFSGCSSLTSITIPASVTSIGSGAFYNCSSLTSITIPASVTYIGIGAFHGCTGLTSVTIHAGVTSINDETFWDCTSLTSVTIPAGVTTIGEMAFYNCSNLTSITIPASVTSIGSEAFMNCSSLTSVTIPAGVTSIPDGLSYYGEHYGVFYGCTNLATVTFANGSQLQSVGNNAFYYCTSLTSIIIPAGVTTIGEMAFYNCSSLTSVTIPAGVTSIGYVAFYNCNSITSVTFNGTINKSAFSTTGGPGFFGDLLEKFYATDSTNGTPGRYTRASGSQVWTRVN